MAIDTVIEARELRKSYGGQVALERVSLTVGAGEILGLLGPNGAGKTTFISILSGILEADGGEALVTGHRIAAEGQKARQALGLVPQSIALYPALTAEENLRFFAQMQGLGAHDAHAASRELLELVGLSDRADNLVATFSGGMKRRLNLACGMVHRPQALLLDEPTVGVDPQSRGRIFSVIEDAARAGAAILYSTHYMEEAERLCGRIVLLDRGKMVAAGTAAELVASAGAQVHMELRTRVALPSGWWSKMREVREISRVEDDEGSRSILGLNSFDQAPELLRIAKEIGAEILEFNLHRPNLQDAFLALTGKDLRDPA